MIRYIFFLTEVQLTQNVALVLGTQKSDSTGLSAVMLCLPQAWPPPGIVSRCYNTIDYTPSAVPFIIGRL